MRSITWFGVTAALFGAAGALAACGGTFSNASPDGDAGEDVIILGFPDAGDEAAPDVDGASSADGGSVSDGSPDQVAPIDGSPSDARADASEVEDAPADVGAIEDALADVGTIEDAPADAPVIVDAPPDVFVDACTADTPQPNSAFVAPGGSGTACTMSAPCGSVETAIQTASSNGGSFVYVASGTYTEMIGLAAGITVQGGWTQSGGIWTRDCATARSSDVVVQAPQGGSVTVYAQNFAGTATLDTLTIRSAPVAAADLMVFGIVVGGASGPQPQVVLSNATVIVTSAGDGAAGSAGVPGANASGTCGSSGSGAAGATGGAGAGGSPNTNPIDGVAYGMGGGSGATGSNGTPGAAAGCVQEVTCALGPPPSGCSTTCSCCAIQETPQGTICGSNGSSGCGGAGGTGGAPGEGGGSSVGVIVFDGGSLLLNNATIQAGNGGAGGNGGPGGAGGLGSAGAPGQVGATVTVGCEKLCNNTIGCNFEPESDAGAPGGAGGTGGAGGVGGVGGGGGGGSSYAIYVGPGSAVPDTTGSTLVVGQAGAGGSGGNPPAASGVAMQVGP